MAGARILIVEDEYIVAQDIKSYLREFGYVVVGTAGDAKRATELANETYPNLVLMDIKLKYGSDGIDAACRIRDRWGIPVVFVTAYADGHTLDRAKAASPAGYITKPITPAGLRSSIEMALALHERERSRLRVEHNGSNQFGELFRNRDNPSVVIELTSKRIVAVNIPLLAAVGRSQQELLGKNVLTLADWTNRYHLNTLLGVIDNPGYRQEAQLRSANNDILAYQCVATQVMIDNSSYLLLDLCAGE
jgi:CheY-like chemotaxis protein